MPIEFKEKSNSKHRMIFVAVAFPLGLLLTLCFLPGEDSEERRTYFAYPRPQEFRLPDGISFDGVRVKQTALKMESGDVLVQHYPKQLESIPKFQVYPDEVADVYSEIGNPWFEGIESDKFLSTFNCVSFAIGDDIGLKPTDHLDPRVQNGLEDPLKIILKDCYHSVATLERQQFHQVTELANPGDIVCFYAKSNGVSHCVHVARAKGELGAMNLISKMGRRGPILQTNMRFLIRHYRQTNLVKIYRLNLSDT